VHQELEIKFNGTGAQILHLGPLELKGGETKYLPIKNDIATFEQLKKISSLSVKKVSVADKEDKKEDLGKDVVIKEVKKKYFVKYVGHQLERPVRGFGSFYKDVEKELKVEELERFNNDKEFVVREE